MQHQMHTLTRRRSSACARLCKHDLVLPISLSLTLRTSACSGLVTVSWSLFGLCSLKRDAESCANDERGTDQAHRVQRLLAQHCVREHSGPHWYSGEDDLSVDRNASARRMLSSLLLSSGLAHDQSWCSALVVIQAFKQQDTYASIAASQQCPLYPKRRPSAYMAARTRTCVCAGATEACPYVCRKLAMAPGPSAVQAISPTASAFPCPGHRCVISESTDCTASVNKSTPAGADAACCCSISVSTRPFATSTTAAAAPLEMGISGDAAAARPIVAVAATENVAMPAFLLAARLSGRKPACDCELGQSEPPPCLTQLWFVSTAPCCAHRTSRSLTLDRCAWRNAPGERAPMRKVAIE